MIRRTSNLRRPSEARSKSGSSTCLNVKSPPPFVPVVRAGTTGDDGTEWLKKGEYGQVPQYLIDRQLQWAAAYAEEQVLPWESQFASDMSLSKVGWCS